jgi:uncharacterized protein (TIGR00251 family)
MTTLLRVRVNPRSSRNQVTGWADGLLHVKLTAPPVEGAANKAAIEFLADLLGVKKSQITLVSGQTGRDKTFEITGLDDAEVCRRLDDELR